MTTSPVLWRLFDRDTNLSSGSTNDTRLGSSSSPHHSVSLSLPASSASSEDNLANTGSRRLSPSSSADSSVPRRVVRSLPDMRLLKFARKLSRDRRLETILATEEDSKWKAGEGPIDPDAEERQRMSDMYRAKIHNQSIDQSLDPP